MAAPKNNLFALGHNFGRPPLFESAEDIFDKINEYIEYEDKEVKKKGKGKYTLEGCALFLGFVSVQSLYDYEKRSEDFSYVIKRFKLWMQDYHVKGLRWGGTMAGSQFWLKNKSDYKDKSEQVITQTVTNVTPQVIESGPEIATDENKIIE
jgi:hypothetical protein